MILKLTEREFHEASEAITNILGLRYHPDSISTFGRKLSSAANDFGFDNVLGFVRWLQSGNLNGDQKGKLGKHFTVTETYFWREAATFTALKESVIPELLGKKSGKNRNIRIWSAGCSSGEEPYSIAMALIESIPDIDEWNINILATDINISVLSKARKGIYSHWSFRNTPEHLRTLYFKPSSGNAFQITDKVKSLVEFRILNLAEPVEPDFVNEMDLIFCRNVLMYFTDEVKQNCVRSFHSSLKDDGWLVISSCELSGNLFGMFSTLNNPGPVFYKKSDSQMSAVESGKVIEPEQTSLYSPFHLEDISFQLPHFFTDNEPVLTYRFNDFSEDKSGEVSYETKCTETESLKVPSFDNEPAHVDYDRLESDIRTIAGSGYLEKALEKCNDAITYARLDPKFYYLRASIQQEMGKDTEALTSLRQLLYLEPSNILGHFICGNIHMKQGETKRALMHYRNVLDLINTMDDNYLLPFSEGLSVGHIRELINSRTLMNINL